ncbi:MULTISPECIES: hypothetical protein [unclassified Corynebacterium]|uniref:hypothetical protein n=1 Tax=unclassified Corynebacterium TaxID=2624378 RepID=UPI0029CA949A|nr:MULTISPECIES: hypothetical protein [unclassified Corynebacterium]WPF66898.1 hypothetical protein OLX12_04020 [Corynebacterium sp. 22KM0430]WPF69386.1 hypothetical protein OLW90_04015 [Corynebacterium sp. 21KM1197]
MAATPAAQRTWWLITITGVGGAACFLAAQQASGGWWIALSLALTTAILLYTAATAPRPWPWSKHAAGNTRGGVLPCLLLLGGAATALGIELGVIPLPDPVGTVLGIAAFLAVSLATWNGGR